MLSAKCQPFYSSPKEWVTSVLHPSALLRHKHQSCGKYNYVYVEDNSWGHMCYKIVVWICLACCHWSDMTPNTPWYHWVHDWWQLKSNPSHADCWIHFRKKWKCIFIFYNFSALVWCERLKSVIIENRDLYTSHYHGCWCPGDPGAGASAAMLLT